MFIMHSGDGKKYKLIQPLQTTSDCEVVASCKLHAHAHIPIVTQYCTDICIYDIQYQHGGKDGECGTGGEAYWEGWRRMAAGDEL